jgi:membrane protease YdiL (CAAX protease family)
MDAENIWGLIAFGALTLLFFSMARRRAFFTLPAGASGWKVPLRWYHVLGAFAIYFAVAFFCIPVIGFCISSFVSPLVRIAQPAWASFLASTLIFLALLLYGWKTKLMRLIWRRSEESHLVKDIGTALLCWVISFPAVIFMNELLDLTVYLLFHVKELPDQAAVHFLKMTFDHPFYFAMTLLTIVGFAPLIEETLFRGFLQTFIRQHLGSKQAILITALCFSCFHFTPEQGLANIPIIGSLFVLALFLGFLYELRGSLAASIALHATFNGLSVMNLYFLGGFPKGPL